MSTPLSDERISDFLRDGFLEVELELDCAAHSSIYFDTDRIFRTLRDGANPHNNIIPMIPGLHDVLDDTNLKDAVTTLLGPNYLIHPHRHCHTNFPNEITEIPSMLQPFHKDGHAHKPRPRHREPRWLILFYSPQDTPLHRGPTAVLPGSHLLSKLSTNQAAHSVPTIVQHGDELKVDDAFYAKRVRALGGKPKAVLCHFDLGHGAMRNVSVLPRYVHKFVLMRTQEPAANPHLPIIKTCDPVQAHLWRWLGRRCEIDTSFEGEFEAWERDLVSTDPNISAQAIYSSEIVARQNRERVIPALLHAIHHDAGAYVENEVLNIVDAVNGLVLINASEPLYELLASNQPALVATAAYGFGQLRHADAIPHLRALVNHDNPGVCRHAISALGLISASTKSDLANTLSVFRSKYDAEEDWDVRLFIVQAVIRMGFTHEALPILCAAAHDDHAYVSSFAIEQLCRYDSDVARQAVIEPLRRQRWFPDPFFAI